MNPKTAEATKFFVVGVVAVVLTAIFTVWYAENYGPHRVATPAALTEAVTR